MVIIFREHYRLHYSPPKRRGTNNGTNNARESRVAPRCNVVMKYACANNYLRINHLHIRAALPPHYLRRGINETHVLQLTGIDIRVADNTALALRDRIFANVDTFNFY